MREWRPRHTRGPKKTAIHLNNRPDGLLAGRADFHHGLLGPLHGYRLARRIEQISGNQLALNQGTLYPALLKLAQMGWISSKWGTSESGRRERIYSLTRAGRSQLQKEEAQWQRATGIIDRFFKIAENAS